MSSTATTTRTIAQRGAIFLFAGLALLRSAAAGANVPGGIEVSCDVDRTKFRSYATGFEQVCFSLFTAETEGAAVGFSHCVPMADLSVIRYKTESIGGQPSRSFLRVSAVIGNDQSPINPPTEQVWMEMAVGPGVLGCDQTSGTPRRRRIQSALFARHALAGVACWDADENGVCDLQSEDLNGDGQCTAADCQGPVGPQGPEGLSVPTGTMALYAAALAPAGWLLCDGAPVSRNSYAELFAVLGTTYGAGNGSTTFNLPDLRGRSPVGKGPNADVDALGDNEGIGVGSRTPEHSHAIPNHTHIVNNHTHHVEADTGVETAVGPPDPSRRYPKQYYDNYGHIHHVSTETWGASPGTSGVAEGAAALISGPATAGYLTTNFIIKY